MVDQAPSGRPVGLTGVVKRPAAYATVPLTFTNITAATITAAGAAAIAMANEVAAAVGVPANSAAAAAAVAAAPGTAAPAAAALPGAAAAPATAAATAGVAPSAAAATATPAVGAAATMAPLPALPSSNPPAAAAAAPAAVTTAVTPEAAVTAAAAPGAVLSDPAAIAPSDPGVQYSAGQAISGRKLLLQGAAAGDLGDTSDTSYTRSYPSDISSSSRKLQEEISSLDDFRRKNPRRECAKKAARPWVFAFPTGWVDDRAYLAMVAQHDIVDIIKEASDIINSS